MMKCDAVVQKATRAGVTVILREIGPDFQDSHAAARKSPVKLCSRSNNTNTRLYLVVELRIVTLVCQEPVLSPTSFTLHNTPSTLPGSGGSGTSSNFALISACFALLASSYSDSEMFCSAYIHSSVPPVSPVRLLEAILYTYSGLLPRFVINTAPSNSPSQWKHAAENASPSANTLMRHCAAIL
eukprot:Hpha_TRINITY_DN15344_c9_g3::TRINITY_DN15344_c9_g3_i1::g.89590::m.89590